MSSLFYEEYFPVLFFFRVLIYSIFLLRFCIFFKCVFDAIHIYRIIYPKWFLDLASVIILSFCLFVFFVDFGSFSLLMEDSSSGEGSSGANNPFQGKKVEIFKDINIGEISVGEVERGGTKYICGNFGKMVKENTNDGTYTGQLKGYLIEKAKELKYGEGNTEAICVVAHQKNGTNPETDPYRHANAHTQGKSVYVPDSAKPEQKK